MGENPPLLDSDLKSTKRTNERKTGENAKKLYNTQYPSIISNVESFAVIFTYRLMKIVLRMCEH